MNGNTDKALADLDQAIELQPDHALANYNRGYANFARQDYEHGHHGLYARHQGRRAHELGVQQSLPHPHGRRPRTSPRRCRIATRPLKLQPDNVQTRETRGFIFLKLGEKDIALREYDTALRSDPDRPLALYGRGLVRVAKGDVKNGETDKAAARALMPGVDRQFASYGVK